MARRVLLLVTALAATLLFAIAPAGAVTPFGPIATVAPAPAGCSIDTVNGDAAISNSDSVIRGFFNFIGPGCDADDIWFAGGVGTSWTVQLTPYTGQVLASDQGFGDAFVLYATSAGISLGERSTGNGSYAPTRQLSPTAPGALNPQGDVLAGPSGTWWAVWTEQVGPGGEFAQTELFQAKTYSTDLNRTQVTNNPDNDSQPALAFKPGGGGELAFIRDDGFGNEPNHSNLRLATAPGTTGSWVGRQFAAIGINTSPSIDTTPGTGGHTYLAWLRDGQVFESDDRSGTFLSRAFVSDALSTIIDVSGGETHVAWGQVGDGTVLAERLGSGDWTKTTVYPAASRLDPIVLSVEGKATVLMASSTRIYKRTQVS